MQRRTGRKSSASGPRCSSNAELQWLTVVGAAHNNLRGIDVRIPLGRFVGVTGVSGSGKSSLVNDILYQALARDLNGVTDAQPGKYERIDGTEHLDKVIDIDQSPIGRTPRSNPATYIKVFDLIRALYAKLPDAKVRGYRPGRFSFNVKTGSPGGGRCEACEGNGANKLDMDFLADVWATCPVCGGARFSRETLQVRYKGKSIADVLRMEIEEALKHFGNVPAIAAMLHRLHEVGLGYLELGQPSTTLSGGEAQRIKLARELVKKSTGRTLYLLDEPTTGLHFHDIKRLLKVLHGFVDAGNTVVVIEHNLDVVKTADWVIDLGPEGGAGGGGIVAEGTPEQIAACPGSYTGAALREVLSSSTAVARLAATAPPRQDEAPPPPARVATAGAIVSCALPEEPPAALRRGNGPRARKGNGRRDEITVVGARQHNLKNVSVSIPRGRMTVCSGVSGSGKTSFALDTVYTEGQRRYVESLSAYARQFLGRLQPPEVDHIDGLAPAISIEQKTAGGSPRSTVGTVTEVYDYLRVLWARIGQAYCPVCQVPIGAQSSEEIVERVLGLGEGRRVLLLAPLERAAGETYERLFARYRASGYARVRVDGVLHALDKPIDVDPRREHRIALVIDRVLIRAERVSRLTDSVEQALAVGNGVLLVESAEEADEPPGASAPASSAGSAASRAGRAQPLRFSQHHSCDRCGRGYEELTPHHFSFNSRVGWCDACEGIGMQLGANPAAIIVNPQRSILDGAVGGWGKLHAGSLLYVLASAVADHLGFDAQRPWNSIPEPLRLRFLQGGGDEWINLPAPPVSADRPGVPNAARLPAGEGSAASRVAVASPLTLPSPPGGRGVVKQPSDGAPSQWPTGLRVRWRGFLPALNRASRSSWQYRKRLEALVTDVPCEACGGSRLRADASAVRVQGKTLRDVCNWPLGETLPWFESLRLDARQRKLAGELLPEIISRLRFLVEVGLDYVTLHRTADTLAGGEAQRIRLAAQLGTGLTGVLYVLDEPTIGLHPRDNARLIRALHRLRDLGNTLLVVEHDREVIDSADDVLDFGPGAGRLGGTITAQAAPRKLRGESASLTGRYLAGKEAIPIPAPRRAPGERWLTIKGAREHNLKSIDAAFPLGLFTCVTGVSGSGKSSLVSDILYPALAVRLHHARLTIGAHDEIDGRKHIDKVVNVDQSPLGSTPMSNPATYTGMFDLIRKLLARLPLSMQRGYMPGRFSFLRAGGRCEACSGMGKQCIEMHFLPDVWVTCEECKGSRYVPETLEVRYHGKSIADVLQMTVTEALALFDRVPRIRRWLQTLSDVGLDYIQLGQSATTLSGGEAQRVKLAAELGRPSTGRTLYILDEPTTGLHFDDLKKLLAVLHRLVDAGNTCICIEHNLDVIKTADWVVDLGPEGGDAGGQVVVAGPPELIAQTAGSHTGLALRDVLAAAPVEARKKHHPPARRAALQQARADLGRILARMQEA